MTSPMTELPSPMTDLLSVRFSPSDQVVAQVVGSETVILHVPSERFVTLDDVAAEMWRIGSESVTAAEAITALLHDFNVERSVLEADFIAFAKRLSELELAQLVPVTNQH